MIYLVNNGEKRIDKLGIKMRLLVKILETAIVVGSGGRISSGISSRIYISASVIRCCGGGCVRSGEELSTDGSRCSRLLVDLQHGVEVDDIGATERVEHALVLFLHERRLDYARVDGRVRTPHVVLVFPLP